MGRRMDDSSKVRSINASGQNDPVLSRCDSVHKHIYWVHVKAKNMDLRETY